MYILEGARSVINGVAERALEIAVPFDALQSYNNPRLEGDQSTYLDAEHIEELQENSNIVHIEMLEEPKRIKGVGVIERYGFTTALGYSYSGLVCIPENAKSDVATIGTSPWITSDRGHNEHTARNFMREGNYVFFVGAEGSWHKQSSPNGPITLADSAAATLAFASLAELRVNRWQKDKIQHGKRNLIGESRGAMTGFGIMALAEHLQQQILYADLTAPCFPDKVSIETAIKLVNQIVDEPLQIARLGGRIANRTLLNYPATLDLWPSALKHQFAIGFALASGEAGALARHIDKDTLLHITAYKRDSASDYVRWQQILPEENYPNLRLDELEGSHLTIADPETLMYLLIRSSLANSEIIVGNTLTQEAIFDETHNVISILKELAESKTKKCQKATLAA